MAFPLSRLLGLPMSMYLCMYLLIICLLKDLVTSSNAPPKLMDVVITWTNTSDPTWKEDLMSRNFKYDKGRFSMNNEVQYNLLSLSSYSLGWVGNVYIVSQHVFDLSFLPQSFVYPDNGQGRSRIIFVHHKSIIPEKYLPTFNSNVIELYIHRIKDLSEIYMYLNDDMMLTRSLSLSRIITKNKPDESNHIIIPAVHQPWFCNMSYLTKKPRISFHFIYINTVRIFMSKFIGACYPYTQGKHFPYVQNKTVNYLTHEMFPEEVKSLSKNTLRQYKSFEESGDFNFLFLSNYVGVYLNKMKFSPKFRCHFQRSIKQEDYNAIHDIWKSSSAKNYDFIVMQMLHSFKDPLLYDLCVLITEKFTSREEISPLCTRYERSSEQAAQR